MREGRPKQSRYDHRAQQIADYILKEVFTIVMLVGQKYIENKNWKVKEGSHQNSTNFIKSYQILINRHQVNLC